jgi:hypothetical protein
MIIGSLVKAGPVSASSRVATRLQMIDTAGHDRGVIPSGGPGRRRRRPANLTIANTCHFELTGTMDGATAMAVHARSSAASDLAGQGSAQAGMCINPSIQRTMFGNCANGISDSRQ